MEIKQQIIARNREQSALYCDPSERVRRATHRQAHPTEIVAFMCMDGRIDLARITKAPAGVVQPFRNVGGNFDLGWPSLGAAINDWTEYTASRGRNRLAIVTHHYSKSDSHLGCKGQGYDFDRGVAAAEQFARQFEDVFGSRVRTTHPIVAGIETDDDALILHSEHDASLRYYVAEHLGATESEVRGTLRQLYPSMLQQTLEDLLPLVLGNQAYVKEVRAAGRSLAQLSHGESVIAVGRGFDWLQMPNTALIIGPYDHKWPDAAEIAGKIVLNNIQSGRVPGDKGVLVLISALSYDPVGSCGWNTGVQTAQYLERVTLETLKERVPDLTQYLSHCRGVLEADTRFLHLAE